MNNRANLWRIAAGLVLGALTVGINELAGTKLPYSSLRDDATSVVELPGMVIAQILFPGGVHGWSPTGWVITFIGTNVVLYGLVWFMVLSMLTLLKRQDRTLE